MQILLFVVQIQRMKEVPVENSGSSVYGSEQKLKGVD